MFFKEIVASIFVCLKLLDNNSPRQEFLSC